MPAGRTVMWRGRRFYVLKAGELVRGTRDEFEVVGTRGNGGFAFVYVVKRKRDGRACALKMSSDLKRDAPGAERIRRECFVMRCCAKGHEDVLPAVLDEGEVEGRPFFVLENLYPLEWSKKEFGLPDSDKARRLFFCLLIDSLKAVHEAGYVHCDIKPGNILERPADHHPVLIDFGSAHPLFEDPACCRKVSQGWKDVTRQARTCTPGYDADEDVYTVQKDIFALGQVMRDSFGETVDSAWGKIINKCISRKREFRYANLDALRKDIERAGADASRTYWKLRKEKIVRQREVERSIVKADEQYVGLDEILHVERSGRDLTFLRVDFPADVQVRYVVNEPIELQPNTVLMISGKGVLVADISGPGSSVVVLRDYATLHNETVELPSENDLTYVLVGPGSYLNFPNLKSSDYKAFFPGRRRILRDIDATTSFRFNGPKTFSGVESETLEAIRKSEMPQGYKDVLTAFFKGDAFTVMP